MKRNSKLSLALHALGHMTAMHDEPYRSEDIARHNGTNAVVVRRVLGQLRRAGLVASARGHSGGWRLAKPAATVSVGDVYEAIGEPFFAQCEEISDQSNNCAVEQALHTVMNTALAEAEAGLVVRLRSVSIDEIASSMRQTGFRESLERWPSRS